MNSKVLFGIQIFVGILLIIFGLNKFLHYLPQSGAPQEMGMFMKALGQTGYMMPLVGAIQVLTGLSFISNKFVALMAIVIVPVMLNAVLAHLFLDLSGIVASAVLLLLIIIVMYKNKEAYSAILKP